MQVNDYGKAISIRRCWLTLGLLIGLVTATQAEEPGGEKAVSLSFDRDAKVGDREILEIEASLVTPDATKKKHTIFRGVEATIEREVCEVIHGRASKEVLLVRSGSMGTRARESLGINAQSELVTSISTVTRASRSWRALGLDMAGDQRVGPDLIGILSLDLDALARITSSTRAVRTGDAWDVDPADLLLFLGPARAKVVGDGSSAKAKLASLRHRKTSVTATVTLEAKVRFRLWGNDDVEEVEVAASVCRALDGSAPPVEECFKATWHHQNGDETWERTVKRHSVNDK